MAKDDNDNTSSMLIEFIDSHKNLIGRIGVYKINFNKNLQRFRDIASASAV